MDLIFADVVLAGELTGRDVAAAAADLRSEIPILFTTGYAREAIVHDHRLEPGVELLGKPFTADEWETGSRSFLPRVCITNPDEARIDGTNNAVTDVSFRYHLIGELGR